MDTTQYIALSNQMALRRRMDTIANNLANMNTIGFRREQLMFQEYLTEMDDVAMDPMAEVSFVQDYGMSRDLTQGEFITTGNPLDAAISGDGFFTLEDPATGERRYSRNGGFKIGVDGVLTNNAGARVLDTSGAPITIAQDATDVTITSEGSISASGELIARLDIVTFPNQNAMKKVGDGMYSADEDPIPAQDYSLLAGTLEGSNVNGITEITDMIEVMRAYQSTGKFLENYEQMRSQSIEKLARVQ
ncbi:MAG: flagellar basal-body rod protein FlgF [Pseudomonadota bacterium]